MTVTPVEETTDTVEDTSPDDVVFDSTAAGVTDSTAATAPGGNTMNLNHAYTL